MHCDQIVVAQPGPVPALLPRPISSSSGRSRKGSPMLAGTPAT